MQRTIAIAPFNWQNFLWNTCVCLLGAASVALITSLLAINGTVQGTGPFAVDSAVGSLILWCLFADLMAITGLILAAVNSGREKALDSLKVTRWTRRPRRRFLSSIKSRTCSVKQCW